MHAQRDNRIQPAEDCEMLPSFDGSNHYLQLLIIEPNTSLNVGDRFYFDQNSKIDGCRLTAVEVHYNLQGFTTGDIDMYRSYAEGSLSALDVISFDDYKKILLTLSTHSTNQSIERMPASSFISLPNQPVNPLGGAAPKNRKPIDLVISTNKSFIETTTQINGGANGVLIPISFYYEQK